MFWPKSSLAPCVLWCSVFTPNQKDLLRHMVEERRTFIRNEIARMKRSMAIQVQMAMHHYELDLQELDEIVKILQI